MLSDTDKVTITTMLILDFGFAIKLSGIDSWLSTRFLSLHLCTRSLLEGELLFDNAQYHLETIAQFTFKV